MQHFIIYFAEVALSVTFNANDCFERFHTMFENHALNAPGACFAVRPEVRWRET